jgi:hypothetical protein
VRLASRLEHAFFPQAPQSRRPTHLAVSPRAKKFTDLSGTAEMSGDLKSIVLHNLTMTSVSSDFDVPIGMRVSGVDSSTYSLTGAAYSTVVPPQTSTNAARVLQADEVALAYEFAKKVCYLSPLSRPSPFSRIRF